MSRRVAFLAISLALLGSIGITRVSAEPDQVVKLTVDYGDGVQKQWSGIAWREGITIADVLDQAAKHRRGLKFNKQGSGDSSFLMQIDDCKNGDSNRFWMYQVNGKKGDRSYAVKKLQANDDVMWKFEEYDE